VIAAHNYESHFGQLKELLVGDSVIFTDMDGIVNTYSVVSVEKLIPSEVETVQKSGYDLVLYTCTKGGQARIAVFCDRNQARTLLPEN
jgi:sortase A